MAKNQRTERDSMGDVAIPHGRLYGAATARAVENFPVSTLRLPTEFIRALASVKRAAARTNGELGLIDAAVSDAIAAACTQVAEGKHDAEFVVDVFQTGSGTSTNMNMNEVIANVANVSLGGSLGARSPVHPNDHVNAGQSSNDVFPTAMHVAAARGITHALLPALGGLHDALARRAEEFAGIRKSGRTHLQDATPLTLGQEFSGYAAQAKKSIERATRARDVLLELPLGGTAVGTGLNAHPTYAVRAIRLLSEEDGLPYREAENHFEAQAARDACVEASGLLRTVAVSLGKIAEDIRWMSSDAMRELVLPPLQPGSSIMPGKVNPVVCESLLQVCAQVLGNDATVVAAGRGGNFELNTMMPVMAHALLQSISLLANACRMFEAKCVQTLAPNEELLRDRLARNPMLATSLAPLVGYDRAAAIAKKSREERLSVRDAAIACGVDAADVDRALDAHRER